MSRSDADLAMAAEGEVCTGCHRPSIECSRDPCIGVIEDRGEEVPSSNEIIESGTLIEGEEIQIFECSDAGLIGYYWRRKPEPGEYCNRMFGPFKTADRAKEHSES